MFWLFLFLAFSVTYPTPSKPTGMYVHPFTRVTPPTANNPILWDDDTNILWDNNTNILWDSS